MAVISVKPGDGSDAKIYIGGTAAGDDKTSWFYQLDVDDGLDTYDQRPIGSDRSQMVQSGISTSGSAVVRAIPDARDFFRTWAATRNEQKELYVRLDGDGAGKYQDKFEVVLLNRSAGLVRDGEQTLNVSFHCNSHDPADQS